MPTGLVAFPLTPLDARGDVDVPTLARLVRRLVRADVDAVAPLGSTGCAVHLDRTRRARVARAAVEHADGLPVVVGIGALRTDDVLAHAHDAQDAGASAVLLAPVSYQPLTPDEVLGLFEDVTRELSVPLVVYDNPTTTRFTFTDDLYAAVASLPHVTSVKIPGVPADPAEAAAHVARLRRVLPPQVTIGVSGDASGAAGLVAGCDAWHTALGGTVPAPTVAIARAVRAGDAAAATAGSRRLRPLWDLFARHGSLRVTAAVAEIAGLVPHDPLPRPLRPLTGADRADVETVVEALGLRG